jgi:hypothetical protein
VIVGVGVEIGLLDAVTAKLEVGVAIDGVRVLNGSLTAFKAERAKSPVVFIPRKKISSHSFTEKRNGIEKLTIKVTINVRETRQFLRFILLPSS